MRYIMILVLVFIAAGISPADIITLKTGLVFKGKAIETTKDEVKLETFKGEVKILKELIKQHDKAKSPYELYETEKDKLLKDKENDAEAHFKLGVWCKSRKIWHKAKFHLQKALELKEDYKEAEKMLKEAEKAWEEEHKKNSYGFTLKVGCPVDLTKEEMEKRSEMLKETSKFLAEITGGMMYFKEVIFTDNSPQGNMLYNPNGASGKPAVPGSHNNYEHGPANWHKHCILHEFSHFMLGMMGDEYDTSVWNNPNANFNDPAFAAKVQYCKCLMSQPMESYYCSSLNHKKSVANAPGCQDLLIAKYKKQCPLLAEGFNYAPDEIFYPPEPKIIINDTKPKGK